MYRKKVLLLAAVPFLLHISCKAQQADNFTGTITINDTIELGDTSQTVANKFGQPDDTENWQGEVSGNNYTTYVYNDGAEFDFVDNQLEYFTLTSSAYKLKLGTFELKVGNNINTLSSAFPSSYSNRGSEGTAITLGSADSEYLNIKTNSSGVITEIELRFIP